MTEHEWQSDLTPSRVSSLLIEFSDSASSRKRRLLGCAFCRMVWPLIEPYPTSRACVEFAERFDDHSLSPKTMRRLRQDSVRVFGPEPSRRFDDTVTAGHSAAWAVQHLCEPDFWLNNLADMVLYASFGLYKMDPILIQRRELMRCVMPRPGLRVTPDPSWLTPTVVGLAGAIYETRAFRNLPVLADALEESGCSDAGVLEHCRGGGEHTCGCWAVDLCLGKS